MTGMNTVGTNINAGGGFGSYMLVNAVAQTLMGYHRRGEQDVAAAKSEQFQEELAEAKREFQDEIEAKKVADMRHKMRVTREYRLIEKFESSKLKSLMGELN